MVLSIYILIYTLIGFLNLFVAPLYFLGYVEPTAIGAGFLSLTVSIWFLRYAASMSKWN